MKPTHPEAPLRLPRPRPPALFHGLALPCLLALGASFASGAEKARPELFFQRLESVGLDTDYVRDLAKDMTIVFRAPTSEAAAEWGYIRNRLYIPDDFRRTGTSDIRYDLRPDQIGLLVHELSHAAYDLRAKKTASPGTPDREHYDAVTAIWADLFNDEWGTGLTGLPRYPKVKADEVSSYYLGEAITNVFYGANDIANYNVHAVDEIVTRPGDAARLGTRLVLPPEDHPYDHRRALATRRFWTHNAGEDAAYFEGEAIPWRDRPGVKQQIFDNVLGLKPPRDAAALAERLNAIDTPYLRRTRQEVGRAREAKAEALRLRQSVRLLDEETPTTEGLERTP